MPQFTDMRRPGLWAADRPRLVDSVVVGYDGSEASRRAVARATAAADPGGRVVLGTATPPSRDLEERIGARRARPADELLHEAAELCRGRDVQVATRVAHAEPVEALVEVVEYQGIYRLCYVRGPEGILIGLAQAVGAQGARPA